MSMVKRTEKRKPKSVKFTPHDCTKGRAKKALPDLCVRHQTKKGGSSERKKRGKSDF